MRKFVSQINKLADIIMGNYDVLIVTNINSDLSKLKFNGFNIVNVLSNEFDSFCQKTSTRKEDFLTEIVNEYQYDKKEKFAIYSEDLTVSSMKKIHDIFSFILIMFPSNFSVEYILNHQANEQFNRYLSTFKCEVKSYEREEFLSFEEHNIDAINLFISKYFESHFKIKILEFPKLYYRNAFESNLFHFSYVAFCISLESIIEGNSELLYRIRRAVAIIVGKDEETSQIVFDNMKKIYDLRSKIVHGEDFKEELVSDYLYYLECLVSKIIIELIVHEVESLNNLSQQITKSGFGDRAKLSKNWNEIILSSKVEDTIYKKL